MSVEHCSQESPYPDRRVQHQGFARAAVTHQKHRVVLGSGDGVGQDVHQVALVGQELGAEVQLGREVESYTKSFPGSTSACFEELTRDDDDRSGFTRGFQRQSGSCSARKGFKCNNLLS